MLESIEKLREYIGENFVHRSPDWDCSDWNCLVKLADEIEREVDSLERDRTLLHEAPYDADGIPWTARDSEFEDDVKGVVKLNMVAYSIKTDKWYLLDNAKTAYPSDACRHVKPHIVEDMLREFADEYYNSPGGKSGTKCVERYADKLRNLLGGEK